MAVCASTFASRSLAAGGGGADGVPPCPDGFACSTVTVPLDWSHPATGTVPLRIGSLKGSGQPGGPALLILAGGPGQAGVAVASQAGQLPKSVLERYQIVFLDQRGTGASDAVQCDALQRAGDLSTPEQTRRDNTACGAQLGARAGDYTTAASVADIEAVRQALGVDRMAIMGTSYGTYVAQRYLATYPQHVDRLVLNSTAPPQFDPFQPTVLSATGTVLDGLRRGAQRDLATLVRRVGRAPIRGSVYDGRGRRHRASIGTGSELLALVQAGDLNPGLRAQLPAALRAAVRGDTAPLLHLQSGEQAGAPSPASTDSAGLNAATTCTDFPMPWAPSTPPSERQAALDAATAALDPRTLGPIDRTTARDASLGYDCLGWPQVATPPATAPAQYAAVPTLILAGGDDMRTPIEDAREVARRLPGAQIVRVAGTGHDVFDNDQTGCARAAVADFLAGQPVGDPCRGKTNAPPILARFPARLSDVPLQQGLRGRPGRALSAVVATVSDLQQAVQARANSSGVDTMRFGGLRGGIAIATPDTSRNGQVTFNLRLRRYAFVPNVRVSGTGSGAKRTARFRVRGAIRGTVRLTGPQVTATIDGQRLKTTIKQPGS